MIRRLHFEEAQPSPQAINPAGQTAETRDDPENDSLALEFKELLQQISGGMAAVSDQAMAVGLALAQSAPLERAAHHKLEQSDKSGDSGDSDRNQDVLDDRDVADKDSFIRLDDGDSHKRGDTRSTSGQTISEDTGPCAAVEGAVQDDLANKVGAEMVEVGPFENVSQELIETISDASQGVQEEFRVDAQDTDKSVEITIAPTEGAEVITDQQNVSFEVQAQVISHVESKVKRHGTEKVEESEEDLFDVNSLNTSPVETGADSLRKLTAPQTQEATQDRKQDVGPSASQGPEMAELNLRQARSSVEDKGPQEAQGNSLVLAQQKDVEGGQKAAKQKSEASLSDPETVSLPVTKMTNRSTEGTIQMTLLRQAFESLKATRQEGMDARAKPNTPTVTGLSAAPEAKGAQNEGSTRSSRAMTKAQTARMLERVEATLKEAARARDGKTISLRLDPANLGRVKVDVSLREGSLHARISPENQQVMVALRENAHDLQGTLRKLGLNVDSVSVTVTSEYMKEETTTGQQMSDGRSFQQERNKLPHERSQVPENTSGNELAERREVQAPGQPHVVADHWVA